MGDLFLRICSYLPHKVYDYIFSRFYMPIVCRNPLKFENEGLYIFKDDSILHKISYIDYCDHNGMNWIEEMERCRKEAGL